MIDSVREVCYLSIQGLLRPSRWEKSLVYCSTLQNASPGHLGQMNYLTINCTRTPTCLRSRNFVSILQFGLLFNRQY